MADETIDIKIKPDIITKASPEAITPEFPKTTASEDNWEQTLERYTIAEFEEGEVKEEEE